MTLICILIEIIIYQAFVTLFNITITTEIKFIEAKNTTISKIICKGTDWTNLNAVYFI
jgi:hypothetical protein